jgi:hypothetical protein
MQHGILLCFVGKTYFRTKQYITESYSSRSALANGMLWDGWFYSEQRKFIFWEFQ